jgi:hypothetical protein
VDQANMHACNGHNITDMSFLNFTIDQPPSKAVCPTPEIFPGSKLYQSEVYGGLAEDIQVRQPTSCPWSSQAPKHWAFLVTHNDAADAYNDLMAINMGPTDSGMVELRIFGGKEKYVHSRSVVTGLSLTDRPGQWAFEVMRNNNLMAINMGPHTDSGMTEVHILTAKSDYKQFGLQTATALNLTDTAHGEWAFELLLGDQLMAIRKGPSESGRTEVKILSKESGYRSFIDEAVTALGSTDQKHGKWSFQVMKWANNDLMAFKVGTGAEAGLVDMRILTRESHYGAFSSQDALVTLPLSGRGADLYFAVLPDRNVLTVRKQGGKYSLQILKSKSNYAEFTSGTHTPVELML